MLSGKEARGEKFDDNVVILAGTRSRVLAEEDNLSAHDDKASTGQSTAVISSRN